MSVLELPSTRAEAWRWADLGTLSAAAALAPVAYGEADHFLDLPGARLLFVNGMLDEGRSDARAGDDRRPFGGRSCAGQARARPWLVAPAGSRTRSPIRSRSYTSRRVARTISRPRSPWATMPPRKSSRRSSARAGRTASTRIVLGNGRRGSCGRSGCSRPRASRRCARRSNSVPVHRLVSVFLGAGGAGTRIDGAVTMAGDGGYAEFGGALLTAGDQRQECAVRVRHAAPEWPVAPAVARGGGGSIDRQPCRRGRGRAACAEDRWRTVAARVVAAADRDGQSQARAGDLRRRREVRTRRHGRRTGCEGIVLHAVAGHSESRARRPC